MIILDSFKNRLRFYTRMAESSYNLYNINYDNKNEQDYSNGYYIFQNRKFEDK